MIKKKTVSLNSINYDSYNTHGPLSHSDKHINVTKTRTVFSILVICCSIFIFYLKKKHFLIEILLAILIDPLSYIGKNTSAWMIQYICIIRHLCNTFPCVIRRWYSSSFNHFLWLWQYAAFESDSCNIQFLNNVVKFYASWLSKKYGEKTLTKLI